MTHRKEKALVCLRGCVANTSLAGGREGRRGEHSTSHHQEPHHGESSAWLMCSVGGTASSSAFPQFDL